MDERETRPPGASTAGVYSPVVKPPRAIGRARSFDGARPRSAALGRTLARACLGAVVVMIVIIIMGATSSAATVWVTVAIVVATLATMSNAHVGNLFVMAGR